MLKYIKIFKIQEVVPRLMNNLQNANSFQGEIINDHFEWLGEPKNTGSMMVGTSPELDMAMFTVCFLARPDSKCPTQMNGQQFQVQTHPSDYDGHVLVGSAYPVI